MNILKRLQDQKESIYIVYNLSTKMRFSDYNPEISNRILEPSDFPIKLVKIKCNKIYIEWETFCKINQKDLNALDMDFVLIFDQYTITGVGRSEGVIVSRMAKTNDGIPVCVVEE